MTDEAYSVVLTPRAEAQLDSLYAYIAEHGSEARAERFVGAIVDTCMGLANFPERGLRRDDIRPNLRTTSHARRVTIAYAVEAPTVVIHGVFYGGQDFEAALRDGGD
ncbi:MAG: type II toxin-antitoxin system RelE/ParE family toxin [Proteobacteria bacterium]|nr:type II toxin-antitoxin system RelE/ParE family toxin [Pseudomonadota bacterium]